MKQKTGAAPSSPETKNKKKPARTARQGNGPVAPGPDSNANDRSEKIRQTAYFLYESRRCEGGHELDDWLQAEALIANPVPPGASLPGL